MNNPLFISVIVPFRNARENIKECVQSLMDQNFPKDRYEIILVDNDSTDGGGDLLKKPPNLVLLKEKKPGCAAARNRAVRAAKGNVFAFTDSDCVAAPMWLANLAKAFEPENVFAVAGEIEAYQPTTTIELHYEKLMAQKANLSYARPYAVTANVAFRKSVFKEVGFFEEKFLATSDVDYSWRLAHAGYLIHYQPEAVVYHKNVKTRWRLFKKTFLQSFYAPRVIKKNLSYVKSRGKLVRVGIHQYKTLIKNVIHLILPKTQGKGQLLRDIVVLSARKLGLLCGSLRYGFLYL